jgi:hypothetical protein
MGKSHWMKSWTASSRSSSQGQNVVEPPSGMIDASARVELNNRAGGLRHDRFYF